MSKVMRINDENLQHIEELRQLFAKVKFTKDLYWDDNKILAIALKSALLDYKKFEEME